MARRIEEYPPCFAGLVGRHGSAELDAARLGGGDVWHGQVEVELFAALLVRPSGRLIALDPTEPEGMARPAEHRVFIGGVHDVPTEHPRPESRGLRRVVTVESEHGQRSNRIGHHLPFTRLAFHETCLAGGMPLRRASPHLPKIQGVGSRKNATARVTSTAAGILRPDQLAKYTTLERLPCTPSIHAYVENYWLLTWDLPSGVSYLSSTLPHPACTLSVERGHTRPGVGTDPVVLTGVIIRRFDVSVREYGWVVGVKFRPGGLAALTGLPVRGIRDRTVPAATFLPGPTVAALGDLTPALSPASCAIRIDDVLDGLPQPADENYDTVLRLVADMLADRSLLSVAQVEERHGIGRRSLQRLFAHYVGASPKWVLARYRMHDAVTELDAGFDGTLADLAARHGWYDQAHFRRDFVRLVGQSPSDYRRAQLR